MEVDWTYFEERLQQYNKEGNGVESAREEDKGTTKRDLEKSSGERCSERREDLESTLKDG